MPKHEAERARPPAHEARTHHPPTHPQRAAQPHRHPDRARGAHEPPVTIGTDRKDRHESPARRPVRPKATRQPDSASEQGHDIALLMKRGLISEKALGRSLPGYQEGGEPVPGQPAVVGERRPPKLADMVRPLMDYLQTREGQDELSAVLGGAGVGAATSVASGVGPFLSVMRALSKGSDEGMLRTLVGRPLYGGAGAGAAVGEGLYRMGFNPRQNEIDREAQTDMQPAASGERQIIGRPLNP